MPPTSRELPFADGNRPAPAAWRWAFALLSVAAGVACLMLGQRILGLVFAVTLFVGLPLAGVIILTAGRPVRVFMRPTGRDIGVGFGFGFLNLLAIPLLGWLVSRAIPMAANPVNDTLAAVTPATAPGVFAITGVQLIGEELVTVIPFFAVLALSRHLGLGRGPAIVIAALAAALTFAAMHFPTYQWHVLQAVLVIGGARLILLGAYLTTGNLWSSIIAHVFNDWTLFGVVVLATHLAG